MAVRVLEKFPLDEYVLSIFCEEELDKLSKEIDLNSTLEDLLNDKFCSYSECLHPPRVKENFKRENLVDRLYRKFYKNRLLQFFENKCAVCNAWDNGLDLDHFFLPKVKGGNFLITSFNNLMNNAVPLCMSCNRSKGSLLPEECLSPGVYKKILLQSQEFTKLINKDFSNKKYKILSNKIK